jgi:predicted nucleotidyltransferase
MITQTGIARLCQQIAEQFAPERIILFGSRASGRPDKDSDVDLLVVMRYKGMSVRKAAEILNAVEPAFPVDLIVRSPEEFETRLAMKDPFFADIMARGKVLYEAAHA